MKETSNICPPNEVEKKFNFTGLLYLQVCYSYLLTVYFIVASLPDSPENITYEVFVWDGVNFTVNVSWINGFDGKVSRYIVYVSQANQPTTYNGSTFSNNQNSYKIVSCFVIF